MDTWEIKIGGFGGQGVILAGIIIGKAAAIYDGKNSTLIQAFGPEARGSACSAQVVVSTRRILYPYVTRPDVLVVMSQEACSRFVPELKENGLLLVEQDLVHVGKLPGSVRVHRIPATRLAEELGRKMVLNVVMVGFFTAMAQVMRAEAVRKSVETSVPKGTEELNLRAFERGLEHGQALLKR